MSNTAGTFSLLTLPDQGESAIYGVINSATHTIDVTMYELRDTTVTTDLVNRHKSGVAVRVILDGAHQSVNRAAINARKPAASPFISTGNLDATFYSTSRDYGVFDTDAADVAAIKQVFNADFTNTSSSPRSPPTSTTCPVVERELNQSIRSPPRTRRGPDRGVQWQNLPSSVPASRNAPTP